MKSWNVYYKHAYPAYQKYYHAQSFMSEKSVTWILELQVCYA